MAEDLSPQRIAERLRALSKDMIDLSADMEYVGGFGEMGQHGMELVGAGLMAESWAEAIEANVQQK
jgi:hypothetical protein